MPRPKRKRFSNPRSRRRDSAPSTAQAPPSPDVSDQDQDENDSTSSPPPPPFFNTTFSTHRVSPLYIGAQPLSRDRLSVLERRLRDVLVGDVVRGIQVGIDGSDDSSMGRAGALELVEMRWVRLGVLLGQSGDGDDDHEQRPASRDLGIDPPSDFGRGPWRRRKALCVSLQYENALCTAILMPGLSNADESGIEAVQKAAFPSNGLLFGAPPTDDDEHFVHLPLLLLRMPPPLKPVMLDFISATFDCRIHPLRLGTRSLVQSWERWLRDAGAPTRGPLARDALVTLGFYAPSITSDKGASHQARTDEDIEQGTHPVLGIKAIDIIIPAADIRRFTETGKRMRPDIPAYGEGDVRKRRKLGGQTDEEGWGWRTPAKVSSSSGEVKPASQPFMEALARYIDRHLALDIFHPAVRIARVACGAFVLSEGRVKVFAPAEAADEPPAMSGTHEQGIQGLIAGLTDRARGTSLASAS